MKRAALNPNIFFETDRIKVAEVNGEKVIIKVRRKRRSFVTTVSKQDFSLHDQRRFAAVQPDTTLRRSNCYFTLA